MWFGSDVHSHDVRSTESSTKTTSSTVLIFVNTVYAHSEIDASNTFQHACNGDIVNHLFTV